MPEMKTFTRDEVAKHNTEKDCWMIIDGDVYDVSSFAKFHPGGRKTLLDLGGLDVTDEFWGLHRHEVLDRYARLKKGRVSGAPPARPSAREMAAQISKVPYAEDSVLQGFTMPFMKESHIELRKAMRRLMSEPEVVEDALDCEETHRPPNMEVRQRLAQAGVTAMCCGPGDHLKLIPGGLCGGVVKPEEFDYLHEMVVQEERVRNFCPGWEDGLEGGNGISITVILKYGKDWMKQDLLMPLLLGQEVCALAITEAYAGSDVASLRTTAVKDASGENYVINGTKKWITCGAYCSWYVTACRTGGKSHGGISMILVPKSDQVKYNLIKTKYSTSAGTAFLMYEDAVVPKRNLFQEEGKGFQMIMSNFNHERWFICVNNLSRARKCTEEVFKWAMQRKVFGQKLVEQPVIREKLAQMFSVLETNTALLYQITHTMNSIGTQGAELGGRIALLKYGITRACHLVGDNAVQILGGRGVTRTGMGRIVETFHRFYKVPSIYGGSEEIMADLAVRMAVKGFPQQARL
mmetsp:Transcript_70390/g.147380  ORF Transcript_70390/g.147380 Transcript_70390/m.147380 type:complete len:520 (+) Transcript_70390:1-1560(+)|eukprot:CAMPEP_0206428486 /NCGR_PEP_ID=MMETSP0324_2-20121206/5696_1 /ASSEMBLY_ACC=CAM_ASM_000836 /TAXON_ID=2866 /ORGANISM="Crypthecodinium cohnii, Strain Seligo" /LENGTH=519 /DNA_ID=CAMNT_0053894029 /DNA_START=73 /DNA_END=1632 /DNA_ORIENTATION=+